MHWDSASADEVHKTLAQRKARLSAGEVLKEALFVCELVRLTLLGRPTDVQIISKALGVCHQILSAFRVVNPDIMRGLAQWMSSTPSTREHYYPHTIRILT